MVKSKMFKTLVCSAVMALTVGTGVFAGTVEREEYVLNKEAYSDSYSGIVGAYTVIGTKSYTTLRVRNIGSTPTLIKTRVRVYDYATGEYENISQKNLELNPGSEGSNFIERDMNVMRYRYDHIAEGFSSTTSGVCVDYYRFIAQQYDA